jgi:hypothetical protein
VASPGKLQAHSEEKIMSKRTWCVVAILVITATLMPGAANGAELFLMNCANRAKIRSATSYPHH